MIPLIFATDGIFPQAVGGMQRHSRLLIETLALQGEVDLAVIHPHHGEQVFDPKLGIKEMAIPPLSGKRQYLIELYQYSKIVANILSSHPDHIIYAQGLSVWNQFARFANRLIINPHGLEPYQGLTLTDRLKGIPYRLIYAKLFNQAKHTVSLGGGLTDILAAVVHDKGRIVVLPNATQLPAGNWEDWVQTRPNQPIHVLFVGRFAANKGIDVLMEAIAMLNAQGYEHDFQFTLAGKGPLYDTIRGNYAFPNTELLGFVSDEQLLELYRTHQLFVLPTLFEGMPTVVLEAMAHGMSIIVTDVGATRELVDESNGFMIQKSSPESIVESLLAYRALSPSKRMEQARASRQQVESRFVWEKVARAHTEIFKAMME